MDHDYRKCLDEILGLGRGFGHREHLLLAWRYLALADREAAERLMCLAIKHVAAAHGTPEKYHETLTIAWIRLVAAHMDASRHQGFDDFIVEYPSLLDSGLPSRHFSSELLQSGEARIRWVEPDLGALP
jgi:hypothetical protein